MKKVAPYLFASDNTAGMCQSALRALQEANSGHQPSYGDDKYTTLASDALRELFECDCEVFFVCTGTAANSLILSSLCKSYESVICHELAHVETDECGAPEFFSNGSKLLTVPGEYGKIKPASVDERVSRRRDIHYPRPRVLSISQTTEAGTVYSQTELQVLLSAARAAELRVHMDGARFFNAVVQQNLSPADMTWKLGVDVLSLSGTKNGLGMGEAVLFFDKSLADGFAYRCKQAGQLLSKMRFVSAPWIGLLQHQIWQQNAANANAMATRLRQGLEILPGIHFASPTDANGVFVHLPEPVRLALQQKGWRFYTFIGSGFARFMCSWNTRAEDVDALLEDIHRFWQ